MQTCNDFSKPSFPVSATWRSRLKNPEGLKVCLVNAVAILRAAVISDSDTRHFVRHVCHARHAPFHIRLD